MTMTYEQHWNEMAREVAKRYQATTSLAQQLGAMTAERDRQIQRAAKAEMELAKLRGASVDALERIISEVGKLSKDCAPSPHACPACEILYVAEELLASIGKP